MFIERIRQLNKDLEISAIRLPNCSFFKSYVPFVDRKAARKTFHKDGFHLSSTLGSSVLKRKIHSCLNNFKGFSAPIPTLKQHLPHTKISINQVSFFTRHGPFSNMFNSPFSVNGELFLCMEQFYVITKARYFGRFDLVPRLFQIVDPIQMKRTTAFLSSDLWRSNAVELILPGLAAKFSQNYVLSELLKGIGDRHIVEASPNDLFWGVGLGLNHPHLEVPSRHRGQNMMGQCLSRVKQIISH